MYINSTTNDIYHAHHEIRSAFPNTSFPTVLTDEILADFNVFPVVGTPPAFDAITQTISEQDPVNVDGVWTRQWSVGTLPQEQAEANLAAAISQAWEAIKAERDRRKALGVKVGNHWYHSDADSRIQQISLFVMGASVPPIQWKTLTITPPPVFVTMTQTIAAGIFQNTAASDAAIFAAAETHRIAMEASPTPEAYDFTGGWPVSIEDEA